MENLLVAEELTKKFGTHTALDHVSLEVSKGSIFGLLGPNGAGKTTLIRIINQITYPDSGRVLFNGMPLHPKHIAMIGYLPEERGLYKNMKVGEQTLYLARLKGLSKAEAKKQLTYWFDRLEIGSWWNKKIRELSKGMAQKIQFVVTVLHQPQLLIFDEPFSGFDPINANMIKDEILRLRDQGATVIFSTHRMESVEELCDEIALLHKSKKILEGNLMAIKRQYRSNLYDVTLETPDKEALRKELSAKFSVHPTTMKTFDNELNIKIETVAGSAPNELLAYLTGKAGVTRFVEVIPSANDIFIKTVNDSDHDD